MARLALPLLVALSAAHVSWALNIVIAGGTGNFGRELIPKLSAHDVTVLSRNAYLASAPARVTEVFGFLGASFLRKNPHAKLRDWDGGDMLDIVGQDWVGWQEDALKPADVVINLVGGYTEQRTMATERIVRESIRYNPNALQISVSPDVSDLSTLTPGLPTLKSKRINECEDMVKGNCANSVCLRPRAFRIEQGCQEILDAIEGYSSA